MSTRSSLLATSVCLDRDDDPAAGLFADLLAAYGLTCHATSPTHDHGGLLDVVAIHSDHPLPDVDDLDVGLSDHRLRRWSMLLDRPCHVYTSATSRPWRQLDIAAFRNYLLSLSLCDSASWPDLGVDGLARLYDTEITAGLDQFIPFQTVTCRRRPSDPWFDQECRTMKRQVRQS